MPKISAPRTTGRTANDTGAAAASARAHNARRGESIEECVLRSLEQYFEDLGGAKPHALHEMVLLAVERPLLKFALDKAGGNQSAAAELLGINRNTLRKKLCDYGLAK
jgi:Fis family transcriptional regulator